MKSLVEALNESKMPEEYAWHGNSAYIISGSEEEGTVAILIGGWNAREIQEAIKLYNADKPSKYDEHIEEVEWDEFMSQQ